MLGTETGELVKMTLLHEGNTVREFYSALPRPVFATVRTLRISH
jgi:hypothetical protein